MDPQDDKHGRWYWVAQGMRGIFSLPAFILMSSFVGFAAFTSESGLPVEQVAFMTAAVWALPAKFVLTGAMITGMSLPAAAIAVSLSSMRLMPMVAALVPEIRTARTPTWILLLLSHFVAVTAWVFTMERVSAVPPRWRTAFFAGFGITLTSTNVVILAVVYGIVGSLPGLVAGALFFLTPIYFLTSIWASARDRAVHFAMLIGLVLGPVFHRIEPELDILWAGIAGGTLAFAADRLYRRSKTHE